MQHRDYRSVGNLTPSVSAPPPSICTSDFGKCDRTENEEGTPTRSRIEFQQRIEPLSETNHNHRHLHSTDLSNRVDGRSSPNSPTSPPVSPPQFESINGDGHSARDSANSDCVSAVVTDTDSTVSVDQPDDDGLDSNISRPMDRALHLHRRGGGRGSSNVNDGDIVVLAHHHGDHTDSVMNGHHAGSTSFESSQFPTTFSMESPPPLSPSISHKVQMKLAFGSNGVNAHNDERDGPSSSSTNPNPQKTSTLSRSTSEYQSRFVVHRKLVSFDMLYFVTFVTLHLLSSVVIVPLCHFGCFLCCFQWFASLCPLSDRYRRNRKNGKIKMSLFFGYGVRFDLN